MHTTEESSHDIHKPPSGWQAISTSVAAFMASISESAQRSADGVMIAPICYASHTQLMIRWCRP